MLELIRKYDVDCRCLVFEITESARFLLDEAAMSFRAIIITGPCRKRASKKC